MTTRRQWPNARVMVKHSRNCAYRRRGDNPGSPWAPVAPVGWRTGARNTPHRRGWQCWADFPCNDTLCPGIIAVNLSELFDACITVTGLERKAVRI
jgi:hypothetical protein